jgi:hypothetical protein
LSWCRFQGKHLGNSKENVGLSDAAADDGRGAPMKAKRPITAPRRVQLAGLTACCARGGRLLLPKTPEGAILASQNPGMSDGTDLGCLG